MIKTFRSKALAELWATGRSAKLDARMVGRIKIRLSRLAVAVKPEDMNVPGFNFHSLTGDRAGSYTVHVNGPWCITFSWEGEDAISVDFEQYH